MEEKNMLSTIKNKKKIIKIIILSFLLLLDLIFIHIKAKADTIQDFYNSNRNYTNENFINSLKNDAPNYDENCVNSDCPKSDADSQKFLDYGTTLTDTCTVRMYKETKILSCSENTTYTYEDRNVIQYKILGAIDYNAITESQIVQAYRCSINNNIYFLQNDCVQNCAISASGTCNYKIANFKDDLSQGLAISSIEYSDSSINLVNVSAWGNKNFGNINVSCNNQKSISYGGCSISFYAKNNGSNGCYLYITGSCIGEKYRGLTLQPSNNCAIYVSKAGGTTTTVEAGKSLNFRYSGLDEYLKLTNNATPVCPDGLIYENGICKGQCVGTQQNTQTTVYKAFLNYYLDPPNFEPYLNCYINDWQCVDTRNTCTKKNETQTDCLLYENICWKYKGLGTCQEQFTHTNYNCGYNITSEPIN
jgi:hypothetical protein